MSMQLSMRFYMSFNSIENTQGVEEEEFTIT